MVTGGVACAAGEAEGGGVFRTTEGRVGVDEEGRRTPG